MKLRNKKTGEIGFCDLTIVHSSDAPLFYRSLAEVNRDWEDDEPAEPLIKDEKIRKAVKAWADAIGKSDTMIEFDKSSNSLWCNRSRIKFNNDELEGLKDWQKYTITELCGEKEE